MQVHLQRSDGISPSMQSHADIGVPDAHRAFGTVAARSALSDALRALDWVRLARLVANVSAGWMVLEPCDDGAARELLERCLDHAGYEEQPERVARFDEPLECARWLLGALPLPHRVGAFTTEQGSIETTDSM